MDAQRAANARALEALSADEAPTLLALLHRAVERHAEYALPGAARRARRTATLVKKDASP